MYKPDYEALIDYRGFFNDSYNDDFIAWRTTVCNDKEKSGINKALPSLCNRTSKAFIDKWWLK